MEAFVTPVMERLADNFDFEAATDFLGSNFWISLLTVTVYIIFVHTVPILMKNRKPFNLRLVNSVWNLFLAIFSFMSAYYFVPRWYELLTAEEVSGLVKDKPNYFYSYENRLNDFSSMSPAMQRHVFLKPDGTYGLRGGFDSSVCTYRDDTYRRGVVGLANFIYLWSKYFELFDTVLLVLQKKKVIFLHWYHHVTVLLYCVIAWNTVCPGGIFFVTANAVVHSVMYTYYFFASINLRHLVAPFASSITMMQILQMVMGTSLALYSGYHWMYGPQCDMSQISIFLTVAMYTSYLVLFAKFFFDRYISKGSSKNPSQRGTTRGSGKKNK